MYLMVLGHQQAPPLLQFRYTSDARVETQGSENKKANEQKK